MTAPSHSSKRPWFVAAVLLILALGAALGSIWQDLIPQTKADDNGGDTDTDTNPPPRMTIKNGVVILTLTATDQQNAGIATTQLSPAPAKDFVHGFGTILDASSLADLNNQYQDAETQVTGAEAKLAASQAAFTRAKMLNKAEQNISTAQLQTVQSAFEVDKTAVAGAQSRLHLVEANARQGWGGVLGAALVNHAPLIQDLILRRSYLVKVTMPPGVVFSTPPASASSLHDGTDIRLSFVSLATTADPTLQGISYLYRTPAQNGLLPGLNLDVSLAAQVEEPGLIVPDSAVVWLEGKAWIYLRTNPTTFVRREIDPTRPGPKDGYIVTSLPHNGEIVVRGAQMLLSEEFRALVPVED